MKRALSVWWDEAIAGELGLDDHGDMTFVYRSDWIANPDRAALSISLPKREEPFGRRACHAFFSGLLPEGDVREASAHALGLSTENDFGLLERMGGEVAGALRFLPEGQTSLDHDSVAIHALTDEELARRIDELPRRPLLVGEEGMRVSLAGAQVKLPVVLVDGRVALPAPGQPTTHIVKPAIARLPATTENEAFGMLLAAAMELDVAAVEPRSVRGRTYLLVTRYDRRTDSSGRVCRVHQEDFCQALGIPPEHKYSAEGGPTFKASFGLLREATAAPATEILKLLDAAIFNLLLGNADAHGKNFSLLYKPAGLVLAPLYDLMCTAAYPQVSANLAMRMGGAAGPTDLTAKTWKKFADDTQLGQRLIARRTRELADDVRGKADSVAEAIASRDFDRDALARFASIVRERAGIVGASV